MTSSDVVDTAQALQMREACDVLLTDLDALLRSLRARNEGQVSNPVRVFPIAYGQDADLPTLKRIAEATNATVYNAADPKSINKVFLAVVSNF